MTEIEGLREKVARIVDPKVWETVDEVFERVTRACAFMREPPTEESVRDTAQSRYDETAPAREAALAKADSILSLVQGGGSSSGLARGEPHDLGGMGSTSLDAGRDDERIISAALLYRLEGADDPRAVPAIVSAPPPARHHNLFALTRTNPDEQGFLTNAGRFVDREEGLRIAKASGQSMIDHPSRNARYLFSEDLW